MIFKTSDLVCRDVADEGSGTALQQDQPLGSVGHFVMSNFYQLC